MRLLDHWSGETVLSLHDPDLLINTGTTTIWTKRKEGLIMRFMPISSCILQPINGYA